MRGIHDGPYGTYIDPTPTRRGLLPWALLALGIFGWGLVEAGSGISDGPDTIVPMGSLVVVVTPDGLEVYQPHDFCSDFPNSPYCKRLAAKPTPAPAPAPSPAPTPAPEMVPRKPAFMPV